MLNKDKIFLYFDRIITTSLCFLIFCLPFSKAGVGVFTGLAFLFWILKRVLGYRTNGGLWRMIPKTELNRALGIFLIINAISVIFSVDHGLSVRGFLTKELKFIVIFFMVIEVINSKQRLRNVLITIVASVVLITADAFVQFFRGTDFLRGYEWIRCTASFSNPNSFAGWLIVIIPLFLGLLATDRIRSKILKILLSFLIVLLLVCLLMTYSRGAWLSFLIGIFVMACYLVTNFVIKSKMRSLIIGVCLFIMILSFAQPIVKAISRISFCGFPTLKDRINSIEEIKNDDPSLIPYSSDLIRFELLKAPLKIIKEYLLIGCGLNTYSKVAQDYKSFEYGAQYPHNSFLQKTAETGLLGLFAFLLVLFSFFIVSVRHILVYANNSLVLGLLSGILAFLVHGFFESNFYALQLVVLFWFMLGLTMAVINLEKQSSP